MFFLNNKLEIILNILFVYVAITLMNSVELIEAK